MKYIIGYAIAVLLSAYVINSWHIRLERKLDNAKRISTLEYRVQDLEATVEYLRDGR